MQIKIRLFALLAFMISVGLSATALAQWQLIGNRDANTLSLLGTTKPDHVLKHCMLTDGRL